MRRQILNQPIDTFTLEQAVQLVSDAFNNPKLLRIVTLNPEMIINGLISPEFQSAINNSELIVPDGTGIIWGLKQLDPEHSKGVKRIPGIELSEYILEIANKLSRRVAIFGGKKEVLEKVVLKFQNKYPNIQFVKAVNGYIDKEKYDEVAKDISSKNPDLILVALGTPKQELWINKYCSLFPTSIMIGIGGSLDVWSGNKMRAPEWIRNAHLEWLFRVITQPKRLSRVMKSLPVFVYMVLKAKKNNKE